MTVRKAWYASLGIWLLLAVVTLIVVMHVATTGFSFGSFVLMLLYAVFFCVMVYLQHKVRDLVS